MLDTCVDTYARNLRVGQSRMPWGSKIVLHPVMMDFGLLPQHELRRFEHFIAQKSAKKMAHGSTRRIYALQSTPNPKPDQISHVGGAGFQLGDRHPYFDGLPMTRVFTLDLSEVKELAPLFPNATALALYVSEPQSNEACEPGTPETAVVPLTEDMLAAGPAEGGRQELSRRGILVTPIDMPQRVFDDPDFCNGISQDLAAVPAIVGGRPVWLQEPAPAEGFALQFNERLAPLNLGDSGVMYVFRDTAFWQSA